MTSQQHQAPNLNSEVAAGAAHAGVEDEAMGLEAVDIRMLQIHCTVGT